MSLKRQDEEKNGNDGEEQEQEESIVERVERYFYEDDTFAQVFENFAKKNASRIDLDSEECKFEYTEMYREFQGLFESKLTEFIESEGSSTKDFYREVRQAIVADDKSDVAVFAQILLATCEFDVFLQIMRETAQHQQQLRQQDEGSSARGGKWINFCE